MWFLSKLAELARELARTLSPRVLYKHDFNYIYSFVVELRAAEGAKAGAAKFVAATFVKIDPILSAFGAG